MPHERRISFFGIYNRRPAWGVGLSLFRGDFLFVCWYDHEVGFGVGVEVGVFSCTLDRQCGHALNPTRVACCLETLELGRGAWAGVSLNVAALPDAVRTIYVC